MFIKIYYQDLRDLRNLRDLRYLKLTFYALFSLNI
ncbi:hypothetical protein BHY_1083 (plasmid) [Borrelia nietonii YOR]|uniref:Uncharacterized protein n=1 Tax=Borrelia nietonii YOR TaxID=1293576 RepID=W5SA97_9SPIR|nr:hypothetical protein BHY_1083 [Borrelia nietonii YOR]